MSELKLIRIYVEPKYLLGLRVVFLLMALPFIMDTYEAIVNGIVESGRWVKIRGEGLGFYALLLKKIVFALFFIWLATGGLKEKESASGNSSGGENN